MVALNFKPQFAALVKSGRKRQTIRSLANKASAGKMLQFYTGQRTAHCRKLRKDAVCKSTEYVDISANSISTTSRGKIFDLDDFAKADGFRDFNAMWKFFEPRADEGGSFNGLLIKW